MIYQENGSELCGQESRIIIQHHEKTVTTTIRTLLGLTLTEHLYEDNL